MRGNQFIQGVMAFADAALDDADGANFALGEILGRSYQPQTPSPGARVPATEGVSDARRVGSVDVPLRERVPEGQQDAAPSGPPTNVRMLNGSATRSLPVNDALAQNISRAVESVYGPGFEARIYSGGQPPAGKGLPRTGSVRHDGGRAADLYVHGPDGNRLQGDALAPLAQFWKANGLGGVGLEMQGGGVHLDDWTTPPPGGAMSWSYGNLTAQQRAALEAGARGELPVLAQEWAGAVVGDGVDVTAGNVYNALNGALTATVSTSGEPVNATSQQVEELIGGMIRDIYGEQTGDEQRDRAHKSSIFENLSVSLGQMAAGQPVNVSSVLRAQEQEQRNIVADRMGKHRMRAGAAAVLDSGGSPALAQAVATGAISYSDVLSERQISNAEAQLARENMQDDTRRSAMRESLRDMGYPDAMIEVGAADPVSFFKLADIQAANDAAELAAERNERMMEGRRATMQSWMESADSIEQAAGQIMATNPDIEAREAMDAALNQAREREKLAAQRATASDTAQDRARQEREALAAARWAQELRTRVAAGDASDVERAALKHYDLSGRTVTAAEAVDAAISQVGSEVALATDKEALTATTRARKQGETEAAATRRWAQGLLDRAALGESLTDLERAALTQYYDSGETITAAEAADAAVDQRSARLDLAAQEAEVAETTQERAESDAEAEATRRWAQELLDRAALGESLTDLERAALTQYARSGGAITANEAMEAAQNATAVDPVVVGNNTIVDRRTGEILYEGERAGPARVQEYDRALEQARAAGNEEEFLERFPTVADYSSHLSGRAGGIDDYAHSAFVVPLQPGTGTDPDSRTIPDGIDYSRAFGVPGFTADFFNTVSEVFTGRLSDEEQRAATVALNRLATNTLIESAEAVAGRPSNFLLQLFEELETRPNRPLTGPDSARLRLQDQLRIVERGIQENNRILEGPFDDSLKQDAQLGNMRLSELADDYRTVLSSLDQAGVAAPVELASPEDVRAGLEDGSIQPGDEVIINGRRFRVRARDD